MSLYIDLIMWSSACLIAISRPRASHSQAKVAGAWHIAQFGSMETAPLGGFTARALNAILVTGQARIVVMAMPWMGFYGRIGSTAGLR